VNSVSFWQFLEDTLKAKRRVLLTIVIEASGSSPGRQGFKMAVAGDGKIAGTVGGGIMENNIINESKALLKKNQAPVYYKRYKHIPEVKDNSGMVCSGEQIIAFIPLAQSDLPEISRALKAVKENKPHEFMIKSDEFIYSEPLGIRERVYIFGGGHVGLALSKAMRFVGFHVVVIDSRAEVATLKENSYAHEIIIDDFSKCVRHAKEGDRSYIVIVTPGHRDDKTVLLQALKKKVKYIGLMGSKSKVKRLFSELIKEGVLKSALSKVHSPIGVQISSKTPEEIAVSIAAEIIGVKNGEPGKKTH